MFDPVVTPAIDNRADYFGALFEESPVGFFLANDRGLIEYINSEAARIIGFDRVEDAYGYSSQDIESFTGWGLMEAFGSVLKGSVYKKVEHRCTNRQGHFTVLNLSCSPYRLPDGKIIGVMCIVQDVALAHKRKAELEDAVYELSVMSQVAEALSTTADLDTILKIILTGVTASQGLGFNRAFLFLCDEAEENLRGKMAVGPRTPEEAGEIWARLAQQQKTLIELLNDYIERESSSSFTLSSMIEGWEISLNGSSLLGQAMNEARWIYVRTCDNLMPDSAEILRRLNTDHLGVAPIISKGKKLGLIAADNQITGRLITSSEMQLLQTFANHTAVAIERSRLYDNLIARSAELERKNQLLAESQEQIVRVEKMSIIGELTSSIAHELRSPLAVIGGFANLMISGEKQESNGEYANIILTEARRAEAVLHQVLDFSRASRTDSRELDFNMLVGQTYELFLSRLPQSRKHPTLNLSTEKMIIWGNPDQLQHALYQFMNLTAEEMTDECSVGITTQLGGDGMARFTMDFKGKDDARRKITKTLGQIFGTPGGTYKLLIIAAGETIRYHGGDYGVEGSRQNLPKIFIELPLKKEENDGQNIDY